MKRSKSTRASKTKKPVKKVNSKKVSTGVALNIKEGRPIETPPATIAKELKKGFVDKALRRHLDERLRNLYDRTAMLEKELVDLADHKFYRTCIFGSARIKPDTKLYKDVANLARFLAWEGIDVLTGGGPGLMEAANLGAASGRKERKTKSMTYGLSIQLPFEPDVNMHLDVKRHHHKFSSRLDDFMRLSHSIIVTPGGIGTVLELFFAWQLIQVKHIEKRPIVLLDGEFWKGILDWMHQFVLDRKLVSPGDFDVIKVVDTPEEAAELIIADHREFRSKTLTRPRI